MAPDADADQTLMLRFAAGDAAAFEQLYDRHERRLFRYLERAVRNRAVADELMQDVWFAVAREAPRYRPSARFTTWLFTMAHNRMVDWLRALRPEVAIATVDGAASAAPVLADARPGPAALAEAGDRAGALLAALESLPEAQREAFLMQVEGELSVEEIALATGTTFETAKSRLRYARARLKQVLAEYA